MGHTFDREPEMILVPIIVDFNDKNRFQSFFIFCNFQYRTGFPQALDIMENLENHKKSSMHGKIMEFEKS